MTSSAAYWTGFLVFILAMLALDLGVFNRKSHVVGIREALGWTAMWISLAVVFDLCIFQGWIGPYSGETTRRQAGLEFLTGYLIELSLSIDNVFVFALLFDYFQVAPQYRHRVLFWGILGALVMRAVMIFAGVALLQAFHWMIYVFGAVLIIAGIKMWRMREKKIEPGGNPLLRLIRRIVPVSEGDHGPKFFVQESGRRMATSLFVVLVLVEWTDLVFAVDSIPAVLGVTRDAFIVFTSNVLAILGLRSLYFAMAGLMERFHLLHYGLAAILAFIGAKMVLGGVLKLPTMFALGVVAAILVAAVAGSLIFPAKRKDAGERKAGRSE